MTEVIWDNVMAKPTKEALANFFGVSKDNARSITAFLAGLHDIGKLSPSFQHKIPQLAKKMNKRGYQTYNNDDVYHPIISAKIIEKYFKKMRKNAKKHQFYNGFSDKFLHDIQLVIGGHHGVYPTNEEFFLFEEDLLGDQLFQEIQTNAIEILENFTNVAQIAIKPSYIPNLNQIQHIAEFNGLLVILSGIITLADWIGSNEIYFSFLSQEQKEGDSATILKYFKTSRQKAKNAINMLDWSQNHHTKNILALEGEILFKQLFSYIRELRPLQQKVINLAQSLDIPSLIIIEAPMGEGKTESAFYLEYYLEQKFDLSGSYIALPTQATANQMFLRLQEFLQNQNSDSPLNLHLLHGNALMSDAYNQLKSKRGYHPIKALFNEEQDTVVANYWFTYKKRGIFSPFAAGTIDQALLAVLPTRHFYIRLFGLAGKILIIDEVHAYDVYMSTILENLLSWARAIGTTVILLSATLPREKRKKLINAYSLHSVQEKKFTQKPYPRITICNAKKIICEGFQSVRTSQNALSVHLKWIDADSLEHMITKKLQNGGRVAIICNTVKRAQKQYILLQDLKKEGYEISLLHSRFPYRQRKKIEDNLLHEYGIQEDHTLRKQILISTQIIEQSLDLDFDLMISDLAPMDLLIQRVGRLHRHSFTKTGKSIKRPSILSDPFLYIIQSDLDDLGIPQFQHSIYSEFYLLRTYTILHPLVKIEIPTQIESLIENTYGSEFRLSNEFQDQQHLWEERFNLAQKNEKKKTLHDQQIAKYRIINPPIIKNILQKISTFYQEKNDDQQLLNLATRLTIPTVNLVCLYPVNSSENSNNQKSKQFYLEFTNKISIDLRIKPTQRQLKQILQYVVKIPNYSLYKYFKGRKRVFPANWRRRALLQNIYAVKLKAIELNNGKDSRRMYFFDTEKYRVYVHNTLGIISIPHQKSEQIYEYLL